MNANFWVLAGAAGCSVLFVVFAYLWLQLKA